MLTLLHPSDSWAHRLPAWVKLALLPVASVGLLATSSVGVTGVVCLGAGGLLISCGGGLARAALRALRPVFLFVGIMLLWFWVSDAMAEGLRIALRMLALVMLSLFLTMTTRFDAILGVVTALLRPLPGVDAARLAFAAVLTLRMTPVLIDKGQRLAEAWRARSPRRPGWRIVLPWSIVALDDAAHVAEALRARGGLPSDRHPSGNMEEP